MNSLKYVAAFLLLTGLIYCFWDSTFKSALLQADAVTVCVSVLWAQAIYALSGLQYDLMARQSLKKHMSLSDIFFLPVAINLWSFLIPVQGGTIYSTSFFKFKYKIELSAALSLSLMIYLITIVLSGFVGVLLYFSNRSIHPSILVVSIALLLVPVAVKPSLVVLKSVSERVRWTIVKRLLVFLQDLGSALSSFSTLRNSAGLIALNLVHVIVSVGWYFYISNALGFEHSVLTITLLVLVMRLSIIFRFTPGNLGVEQAVSGAVLAGTGGAAQEGIVISLFATASSMVLVATIGAIFTMLNGSHFRLRSKNPPQV